MKITHTSFGINNNGKKNVLRRRYEVKCPKKDPIDKCNFYEPVIFWIGIIKYKNSLYFNHIKTDKCNRICVIFEVDKIFEIALSRNTTVVSKYNCKTPRIQLHYTAFTRHFLVKSPNKTYQGLNQKIGSMRKIVFFIVLCAAALRSKRN